MPNRKRVVRLAKRNRLKVFVALLIFLSAILFIKNKISGNPSPNFQPPENYTQSPSPSSKSDIDIQKLLEQEIKKLPGSYNVYIKNLKSGRVYSVGADSKIPSASIYKLAVMYKTFDALNNGELKKDQQLNNTLTVERALELMITVSDNEAALLLAQKLGWSNINNFLTENGINGFDLMVKDYPTTTAKATSDLLEKIYRKEAVSKDASEEMIALLIRQTRNDRIPLNLPKKIEVAHKTGELDNFRHDAGIVFGLNYDYIFVFLTETPVPEESYANIAQLSKKLFEALEAD